MQLPLINTILREMPIAESAPLKNTGVVCVHHHLKTSINLIDAIIQLGADPNNIFILGKSYSSCASVVNLLSERGVRCQPCSMHTVFGKFSQSFIQDINWLWLSVMTHVRNVENLIVLDHGGHALNFIPRDILKKYRVIGVEKTASGITALESHGLPPCPIINLANSVSKKILESPLIAEGIVKKLPPSMPINNSNLICGVVGYGAIGKAIVKKLLSMGHDVLIYDYNQQNFQNDLVKKNKKVSESLYSLIECADYIFGCTGSNITAHSVDYFRSLTKNKTLISCSSEDIEFLSLLRMVQKKNNTLIDYPFSDIIYHTDMGATIRILRGGFPINFDDSGESVPEEDIQLTRGLVLGSVLQAIQFFKNHNIANRAGMYMLDPNMQKFIVNRWINYQPPKRFPKTIITKFQNEKWIVKNSEGVYETWVTGKPIEL